MPWEKPSHVVKVLLQIEDKSQQGRCLMECSIASKVGRAGEKAAPEPTYDGSAHEASGVIWWEEEDL
jgi:hypothetical protein